MKLALMALMIEICLVRLFIHSWGWAAVFVLLYCAFVYLVMWRKVFLLKKQNKKNIPDRYRIHCNTKLFKYQKYFYVVTLFLQGILI